MLDRDQERAMLEEAAKNAPAFNLPANFGFTDKVGHLTTSNFLTDNCSQVQPIDDTASKKSHTEPPLSEVPPAQEMQPTVSKIPNFFANSKYLQNPPKITYPSSTLFGPRITDLSKGSTTFVSNPAPSHASSSISSPGLSCSLPSANLKAKGHFNPSVSGLPVEDAANPLWNAETKIENAQRDQIQIGPPTPGNASQAKSVVSSSGTLSTKLYSGSGFATRESGTLGTLQGTSSTTGNGFSVTPSIPSSSTSKMSLGQASVPVGLNKSVASHGGKSSVSNFSVLYLLLNSEQPGSGTY